jgi:hypothetical protein
VLLHRAKASLLVCMTETDDRHQRTAGPAGTTLGRCVGGEGR